MEEASEKEKPVDHTPQAAAAKPAVRFFAAVQDLFFGAKITAAAKRVGVGVQFIRDPGKLCEAICTSNEATAPPSVLMIDLNDASIRPIELIAKLKSSPSAVQIIAFVSHVQGELSREAQKAGADLVLPRSVFSQQLDELLRQRSCHL